MFGTGPARKHRSRRVWFPAALGLAALLAGCASQPIVLQVYEGEAQTEGLAAVQAFAAEHRHGLEFPATAPARSAVDATLVYSNDWPTASAARQLAAELEALGLTAVLRPTALENHVVFDRHIGVFFRPPGAEQTAGDDEARPAHFACVQDDGAAEALMLLYADGRLEVQTYLWTEDDTVIGQDHAGRWRKGRRGITLALDDGAAVEFRAETGCLGAAAGRLQSAPALGGGRCGSRAQALPRHRAHAGHQGSGVGTLTELVCRRPSHGADQYAYWSTRAWACVMPLPRTMAGSSQASIARPS